MRTDLSPILDAFGLGGAQTTRIPTGLIHHTHRVDAPDGRRYALQSVSPIFAREVHYDIDAVTRHLEAKGLYTPRLVPTTAGTLWHEQDGEVWRVLTWLEGTTRARVESPADARSAAALLGRFHAALSDLAHTFRARRLGVHDTARHLAVLATALEEHHGHRLYAEVRPLADELMARTTPLLDLSALPDRVVHGDPKITNVLFHPTTGQANAMVDLDTIAPMKLAHELGDALRSWSNPSGEDATEVRFDAEVFGAALAGYAAQAPADLSPAEIDTLAGGTRLIILELSARFAADALNERYFGWDAGRFATRGDHNLLRARAQLLLARDFDRQAERLDQLARAAFTSRA